MKIDIITETYNPIIEWFDVLWSKLHVIETDVYHNNGGEIIYYINGDGGFREYIFYIDDVNKFFWCNLNNFWNILKNTFGFIYAEIQDITEFLVERALGRDIPMPQVDYSLIGNVVDRILNVK